MSTFAYKDFEWRTAEAGDGESGVGLARIFIDKVKTLKDVKSICDLACGNGFITGHLASLGYKTVGVDASETGIRIATRQYPASRFVMAQIDSNLANRFEPHQFDLVISSDAIEHFYCPSDLLRAAVLLLKPNGHLLLGTPYHGYLKNLLLSVSGKMDNHFNALQDGGHIKFFSVKTLSELVRSFGFTDLDFTFYGRAPWLWKNMICSARWPG